MKIYSDSVIGGVTKRKSLGLILDLDSGQTINTTEFINREVRLVIQDRNLMRSRYRSSPESPWLVCSLCGAAVQLVSFTDRSFYFRHMPEEEDRGCPINTKSKHSPDEINAMQYNGAKESQAHLQLKQLVKESILADTRFSGTLVEKVWRGMNRKCWRKPDVQTSWDNKRLVFEIQLSTTFLSVIVDRRDFYRNENSHLIWIFQRFDPQRVRRAEEDIFYNNNSNVFIVNSNTVRRSKDEKRFFLECWYAVPRVAQSGIEDYWQSSEVSIDQLNFDLPSQRVFYFDYDAARKALEESIVEEGRSKLITAFEDFWRKYAHEYSEQGQSHWVDVRDDFKNIGIELPEYYDSRPFAGVISMMLSAKYGVPIGYRYQTLIEVTNVAFNSYKKYLYLFGWALKIYGHETTLEKQDVKGTWLKRRNVIRSAMKKHEAEYERDTAFDALIIFLLTKLNQGDYNVRLG